MIGLIGGSGFENFLDQKTVKLFNMVTKWGAPSQALRKISLNGREFMFMQRHGGGKILPHKINYQANISALHELGVNKIIASAAVGGINFQTNKVIIPDQIIDYTYGRAQTFFENSDAVKHIEFSQPYNQQLRIKLIEACEALGIKAEEQGVHAVTQGPRLETAAEIRRLKNDGCDIVGMTGMPEACLAAELDIKYACIAYIVNPAAGVGSESISISDMQREIRRGAENSFRIFKKFILND